MFLQGLFCDYDWVGVTSLIKSLLNQWLRFFKNFCGDGATIGFKAKDTATIDEWHKIGEDNGGVTCEDPPGVRDGGGMQAYLGYLKDPSGNKICTMHNIKA